MLTHKNKRIYILSRKPLLWNCGNLQESQTCSKQTMPSSSIEESSINVTTNRTVMDSVVNINDYATHLLLTDTMS